MLSKNLEALFREKTAASHLVVPPLPTLEEACFLHDPVKLFLVDFAVACSRARAVTELRNGKRINDLSWQ